MKEFFILTNVACLCHIISTQSDVRMPPTLTRWPQRKEISYESRDQFTLECGAVGTPAVRYEWKKNGFQLNTDLSRISKGSDGKITINRATKQDEGYYQCFAKNQYGTVLSNMIHVRMIFFEVTEGSAGVRQQTVVEGMQFHIENFRTRSFPEPWYEWHIRADVNARLTALKYSKRIQVAKNGDLHFAYALREDASNGTIYICSTRIDTSGSIARTQLTVTRNASGNINRFAPTLAFASAAETVALVGESTKLRCFFYGYPEPTISWRVTTNRPHTLSDFNTTLNIDRVDVSDEGNYSCTASNIQGNKTLTFQIRVEAEPNFTNTKDGPYDVNVTEGDSFTFNCNVFAIPEANILWLQNGQPIDTDNPPKRFVFTNNKKSLTIRDVCRDCVDRENKTDLTVIQCNASNVYGYAFASGYLNVLLKTKVAIRGSRYMSVDFLEERQFVFQCYVTSDPSTPPTVRWYKTEPHGDLVRDEPPYVYVAKEFLIIMTYPKCSSECAKYLGEYICVGDNGYSQENRSITYNYRPSPDSDTTKEESCAIWKILLGVGVVGVVLLLIGIFVFFHSRRHLDTIKRRTKGRKLPHPPSMYERVGYDSVDLPLQRERNNGRSMRKAYSMYEHVGYDSIDQVLKEMAAREGTQEEGKNGRSMRKAYSMYECVGYDSIDQVLKEMAKREGAAVHSADIDGYRGYESIDAPQKEAISTGRAMLDEDTMYDDTEHSVPLEEVTNNRKINQQQINGHESVQSESGKFPKSNEQSESRNTYSDLNREEIDSNSDLENSGLNPIVMNTYLDLVTNEVNQYLDLNPKEVNQYSDLGPKEVNQYLDLDTKEVNQYSDLGPKEVNKYLDLDPTEVNQNLDQSLKELNQYLGLDYKEANLFVDLGPKEVNPYLYQSPKKVNQNTDLGTKEGNQYCNLDVDPK